VLKVEVELVAIAEYESTTYQLNQRSSTPFQGVKMVYECSKTK